MKTTEPITSKTNVDFGQVFDEKCVNLRSQRQGYCLA